MKLLDILKEIGEASAKPYKWHPIEEEEDHAEYWFKTDSGLDYKLEIAIQESDSERDSAAISFGIMDSEDYFTDYEKVPTKGELYKVMATIVDILKDFIKKNKEVKYLYFTTNKLGKDVGKDQSARLNLYRRYIQTHLPNAKINTKVIDGEEATIITLKEIGDAGARSYEIEELKPGEYYFETESGIMYKVNMSSPQGGVQADVGFGVVDSKEDKHLDFSIVPTRGELYKVMATVTKAVKDYVAKNQQIEQLWFVTDKDTPNKSKRADLYARYVSQQLPGSKLKRLGRGKTSEQETLVVTLKK